MAITCGEGRDVDANDNEDATDGVSTSRNDGQLFNYNDNPSNSPPVQSRRSGRALEPTTKYPPLKYVFMNDKVRPHAK